MNGKLITGIPIIEAICQVLDISPDRMRRIVIDAPYNAVPSVYIEMIGDDRLVKITWAETLANAEIVKMPKDNA